MAAQLRYRTLVHNIGRVYASPADGRTDLLQAGLDEIVATQRPAGAKEWNTVGTDSERLLKVWVARENNPAAHEVAAQIVDLLYELAAMEEETPRPALVVTEPAATDHIAHIPASMPDLEEVSAIEHEEGESEANLSESEDTASEDAEDESEEEEIDAEVEAAEAEEEIEAEGAAVTEAAEEEEVEEEVLEPEAEEEEEEAEEEGMEVEQIFIRGRAYWHETNTHKLYALQGEDDVGDEVGELVEGKPRFYAK